MKKVIFIFIIVTLNFHTIDLGNNYNTNKNYNYLLERNKQLLPYVLNEIKKHESLSLHKYFDGFDRDTTGTIGYGHILKRHELHLNIISEKQADSLLELDFKLSMKCIIDIHPNLNLETDYNKIIALSHFVYCLGIGTYLNSPIKKQIDKNDFNIDNYILNYCHVRKNGKYIKSKRLYELRMFELKLFKHFFVI